jgi:hypothetical protein
VTKSTIPPDIQKWIDAKKKSRLSQMHICIAMELGIPPRKLGGMGANPHELWKSPLPEYLEELYEKRFGSSRKPKVRSFVEIAESRKKKKPPNEQVKTPQPVSEPAASDAADPANG